MKLKLILMLSLSVIFILNTAMSCEEDYDLEDAFFNITSIEAYNINNEGEYPFISDEPIRKEAYVIGIKRFDDIKHDSDTQYNYILEKPIVSEKIICLTDLSDKYTAGSDVTGIFIKSGSRSDKTDYIYVLREKINPGTHSFKIVAILTDDSILEAITSPVELY